MNIRALWCVVLSLCFLTDSRAVWAQGTIQFGFEEFQPGETPPFVTGPASIKDNADPFLQGHPLEGQRFLLAGFNSTMQSPDGMPIKSFTVHVFVPTSSFGYLISVGGAGASTTGGDWQTLQRTLDSPVDSLLIYTFWSFETLPASVAIDSVELVTAPEPRTLWLLGIGAGAIFFGRRLR